MAGRRRYKTVKIRVVADRVLFIGGRKDNYDEGDAGSNEYDDDIPFLIRGNYVIRSISMFS